MFMFSLKYMLPISRITLVVLFSRLSGYVVLWPLDHCPENNAENISKPIIPSEQDFVIVCLLFCLRCVSPL